jgi:transposase
MEAPMKRVYFIGLDTHGQFCDMTAITQDGQLVQRGQCKTTIPAILNLLEQVPQPRRLAIEEGPLADWLWRNLRTAVAEMVVCEPRRNRLIAAEGDKDDPIDSEKLAQLYRGGYLKKVHHTESLDMAIFKQHVLFYHQRVSQRVREGHRARGLLRRHGVIVKEKDFAQAQRRPALLERLPASQTLQEDMELLWESYDVAAEHEEKCRRRLIELAKKQEAVRRFVEMPGIGWIRGATFYVFLDTPWRFPSKAKLWKYLGIGLERQRSGTGPERLRVPKFVNRVLKSTILCAATSAASQRETPFADQHRRLHEAGLSAKLTRRTVARSLAATLWGLWKNGSAYRPDWVGVAGAAMRAASVSLPAVVAPRVGGGVPT